LKIRVVDHKGWAEHVKRVQADIALLEVRLRDLQAKLEVVEKEQDGGH
jgi:hypothetical protein